LGEYVHFARKGAKAQSFYVDETGSWFSACHSPDRKENPFVTLFGAKDLG
jgi:hypothetical protein